MSRADQAWIARALRAWRLVSGEITAVGAIKAKAVFYDASCTLTGDGALSLSQAGDVRWSAAPHGATVRLPNGSDMHQLGVVSFADTDASGSYFVMSTPSVWRAAGVAGADDLETTMVSVLIHESTHIAQLDAFNPRFQEIKQRNGLPDPFTAESLQRRFEGDAELGASIARDTELFLAAARSTDDSEARRLARQARELMRARAARWYVGAEGFWAEAEDVGLTLEGTAQWVAYRWLIDPQGAAEPVDQVQTRLAHGHWWSKTEGFALALAVDRIVGPSWKDHAFGPQARTNLSMLDAALAGQP